MRVYVLLAGYRADDEGQVIPVIFLAQKYGLPAKWAEAEGLLMPFGGGVEAGETVEQAANRELQEEIGDEWVAQHRLPAVSRPFGMDRKGKYGDIGLYGDNHFLVLPVDVGLAAYRRLLSATGARDEGGAVAVPYCNVAALRSAIAPHILPAVETLFAKMDSHKG